MVQLTDTRAAAVPELVRCMACHGAGCFACGYDGQLWRVERPGPARVAFVRHLEAEQGAKPRHRPDRRTDIDRGGTT